jgi:hypothetical protein
MKFTLKKMSVMGTFRKSRGALHEAGNRSEADMPNHPVKRAKTATTGHPPRFSKPIHWLEKRAAPNPRVLVITVSACC